MVKKYIERYWRKATLKDIADGPFPDARFRNTATMPWDYGRLIGFHHGTNRPYGSDEEWYQGAEVYDAPDPGEGYELIDITDVTSNDEWSRTGANWWRCETAYPTDGLVFFRRKIKPVAITFPGIRSECRPLAYAEMVESTDIYVKDGKPLRAATDVGLLQGNTSIQYYREVNPKPGPMELKVEAKTPESFGTTTELQIIAEKKPEAAEPVTFVAHPIQINKELEYCFKGKPIQFRSYAVLNEQGHYLQHLPAYPPQYAPEFRQAFTPLQLLQLSVRELGRNIRLRAVEPVDEPKAKSDSAEPIAMFIHPIETMCVKGVHSYALRGEMIPNRSYAVMNKEGKYLYTLGDGEPVFLETFCQAFTPLQLREVHAQYIQDIHLRAVEPLDMDKIKQEPKEKLQPKAPAWEPKRQKVSWKDREYWVLTRFHVVKDRGHDPTELVVLQDITDRDGDQLRFVPSQHFEKAQPEATQPVKEPKYVPFEWEDREQLRGRVIAFTERNRKVEFRCEHFQHDSDGLLVNEFYAPWLCKNAVFTDTKEPVGKRVED